MTLETILKMFYYQEQNISISSFWDSGWDFKIGDPANGFKYEANFDLIEDGRLWLLKHYSNLYGEKLMEDKIENLD